MYQNLNLFELIVWGYSKANIWHYFYPGSPWRWSGPFSTRTIPSISTPHLGQSARLWLWKQVDILKINTFYYLPLNEKKFIWIVPETKQLILPKYPFHSGHTVCIYSKLLFLAPAAACHKPLSLSLSAVLGQIYVYISRGKNPLLYNCSCVEVPHVVCCCRMHLRL